jgi:hypothetical protein
MMLDMRTTVTFDKDVAQLLASAMKSTGEPMKKLVNDVLRAGLPKRSRPNRKRFKIETFKSGFAPGVDADNPKAMLEVLDQEYYEKKLGYSFRRER